MIEGIRIDVPAEELKEHILDRAKDHTDKAISYQRKVKVLEEADLARTHTSLDPIGDLDRKVKEHQDKAAYFLFMAEHLVMDETYRLDQSELARLEIAARYF